MNVSERQLFIASPNYPTRSWHPLARLKQPEGADGPYEFAYTKGVKDAGVGLTALFQPKPGQHYFSGLPPIVNSRLMRPSRPDYRDWLSWMDLSPDNNDPFEILARTGGSKVTDQFETFLKPEPDNGKYRAYFFLHGMRYFPLERILRAVKTLREGDRLLTMSDFENRYDRHAVAVRSGDSDRQLLGYLPGHLAYNFRDLLLDPVASNLSVHVHKMNADAPLSMKVLCRLQCDWPKDFAPCTSEEFQLL